MLTAPAGTGPARSAGFRLGLVVLLAAVAGCSGKPSLGSIEVLVNLEPGLTSRCVKVTARDGVNAKETKAIPLDGKMSPLRIGMQEGDGLVSPVTVQALGYRDDACTMLTPGELSAEVQASYGNPTNVVTLTLSPVSNGDGGTDGGEDAGTDAGVDAGTDAGTDGGMDAGIDNDGDGSPLPADCDDMNPNVHPGADETLACGNGVDDDCNGLTDCADPICAGFTCGAGGTCVNLSCTAEICSDGTDNNGNGLIDCADPACVVGDACTDSNACTTGDRCVGGGMCQKTGDVTCSTPPAAQCYVGTGVCLADAGATCFYAMTDAGCDDTLGCTINDSCANGTCSGTARPCTTPPNSCFAASGTCTEPGTCNYAPLAMGTGTCTDGNNCTTGDTCAGDGGCTGNLVTCTPNQCQTSTGCDVGGACLYGNRNGQTCDAGTGGPATCDLSFNCNATPATLFPFPTSNFVDADLSSDAGVGLAVTSSRTLNTDTPSISVGTMPPFTFVTPPGGQQTLLVRLNSLSVNALTTLTITGNRPVIFAVVGNVLIDGRILIRTSGASPSDCGNGGTGTDMGSGNGFGGGGGAGFGSDGGVGGASGGTAGTGGVMNGQADLKPLRAGCSGGPGGPSTTNGGAGGGALQISASGTITVNDIVTAPGRGGTGATNTTGNAGGGGGSGGAILLECTTLTLNGGARITANGGGGGEGSAGGNTGGNGSDGTETLSTGALGGFGGSGNAGNGGSGGARNTLAGAGLPGNAGNDGSGGGGGGVGRIRFNASNCVFGGGLVFQVISPLNTGTVCN